jgi:hypothetical protein
LAIHLLIDAAEDRGPMLFARLGILNAMEGDSRVHAGQPTPRHLARPSWRFQTKKLRFASPYRSPNFLNASFGNLSRIFNSQPSNRNDLLGDKLRDGVIAIL